MTEASRPDPTAMRRPRLEYRPLGPNRSERDNDARVPGLERFAPLLSTPNDSRDLRRFPAVRRTGPTSGGDRVRRLTSDGSTPALSANGRLLPEIARCPSGPERPK